MDGRVILEGWAGFVVMLLATVGGMTVVLLVSYGIAECCMWLWRRIRGKNTDETDVVG